MTVEWETKRLDGVVHFRPPLAEARRRLSEDALVSFVPMENLGIDQKFLIPRQAKPLRDVVGGYTYFADGDVLLAKITPCFENGKLGIAAGLTNGVGFGSSEYIVLRPGTGLSPEWLYYYLSRKAFRAAGAGQMAGAVGHKRVAKEFIERYPIPVPPLREQQRIVAVLDEKFEAVAAARSNIEHSLRNAHAALESHLQAVFLRRGKGWEETTIDQVSVNLDSRRRPITKGDRRSGEFRYYGASGVVDHVADYLFEGDTLLISEDGANLLARSTPIAFSVSGKYWVNNHAHVLQFPDIATQRFVEFYLASMKLDRYITGAAQPKLTQKALNSIPIPMPGSVDARRSVFQNIEAVTEGTQRLMTVGRRKLAALSELEQSLLHEAFAGAL